MKKAVIITLILLIILIIIWKRDWIKEKIQSFTKKSSTADEASRAIDEGSTGTNYQSDDKPPLKRGSRGDNVLKVQKALNILYNSGLTEDGIFGPKTEEALNSNGYGKTVETADILKLAHLLKSKK